MCPKAIEGPGDSDLLNHEWCSLKAQVNGTTSYMPAMFGLTISSLVVKAIEKESSNTTSSMPNTRINN